MFPIYNLGHVRSIMGLGPVEKFCKRGLGASRGGGGVE